MHNIEPFYNWRHIYVSEEDELLLFMAASILSLNLPRRFTIIIFILNGMILAAVPYT